MVLPTMQAQGVAAYVVNTLPSQSVTMHCSPFTISHHALLSLHSQSPCIALPSQSVTMHCSPFTVMQSPCIALPSQSVTMHCSWYTANVNNPSQSCLFIFIQSLYSLSNLNYT